ncbi:MAG: hypothetical protein ABFS46_20695, partial [Myxococcota bacterium]
YHVGNLRDALDSGTLLPAGFRYPSLSHWLCLAALAPEAIAGRGAADGSPLGERLLAALAAPETLLRIRTLFLVVCSLSLLPVLALVLRWRGRVFEAFVAAALLGTSWEVAYHARWLAPDGVVMTFAALTLFGSIHACLRPGRSWPLVVAALAAGFACGTKWTAGLLLLPVLMAGWIGTAGLPRALRLRRLAGLVAGFGVAYLLTTPGTLLDPGAVLRALELQQGTYASGHLGHTVARGPGHLLKVFEYLGLVLFSHYPLFALACFGLSLVGAHAIFREAKTLAVVFASFPVAYLLFFSLYPVMIPRNYLVLAPFLAVLAARGVSEIRDRLPGRMLRGVFVAAVSAMLLIDAAWLVQAGESIRSADGRKHLHGLAAYLDAHPDTRFAASEQIRGQLRRLDGRVRENVTSGPLREVDEVVFYASESYPYVVALRPRYDLSRAWFGPYEVNFNFYPSWLGSDRIVVLPAERYPRRPGLPPDRVPEKLRPGRMQ